MQTTVVLHATARPSYFRWLEAVEAWCESVGPGMTAEMIAFGGVSGSRGRRRTAARGDADRAEVR